MTMTAADTRRFLAEEIRVSANVRSPLVIEALSMTPRERFLPPGPWIIRGTYDSAGSRVTDDADPRHVYHDVVVAIDPSRNLFNGQPSLIARWIDELGVAPGEHVVHIGCATGYFTALLAHVVGPTGRVDAIEIDPSLAAQARVNLADTPWVTVSTGNGRADLPPDADVVLVHAGATHFLDVWLDALRDGGRLLVPLTLEVPGMPASIGKGFVVLVTRNGQTWNAKAHGMVAIYSLKDLRDDAGAGAGLGKAMMSGAIMKVGRLRRDPHDAAETCIVHGANCLSTA
jgi:protein-L-isoaspartate(D-aspartate) O-methyltransferase